MSKEQLICENFVIAREGKRNRASAVELKSCPFRCQQQNTENGQLRVVRARALQTEVCGHAQLHALSRQGGCEVC